MSGKDNDYTLRISQATPNELNIITFELCIKNINEAVLNIEGNDKLFSEKINTALAILKEIILSLNLEYELSKELSELYLYVNKLLIQSKFNFNKQDLLDSIEILTTIKNGFEKIDEKDAKPVVKNASKVFAGLTYGKEGLSEYIDSSSTGFKA